ncbi:thiamine diphosphokinase [Moheibacter stercoris]|uniref:Thiamine diphosphokinase n=1 Tax=Moheibacter stercoris TaxID=1628251 RepID=A0ABV2LTZ6_9FLAO
MNKVALFLNGQAPKLVPNIEQYELIYCTDGAYGYLSKLNIQPDVITGDMDSLDLQLISDGIEIIPTPDQNFTDFEKALQIINDRKHQEVHVYGSSGMEHDHFLGNLTAGLKFKEKLTLLFFDDYSYYFFADNQTRLDGYEGRIISLYPFPETKNITTKGLKYPLQNEDLSIVARIGTRNRAESNEVEINFEEGNLLIFIQNK